jgi:protein TonB
MSFAQPDRRDRAGAAIGVVAVHALIGYALIVGLGVRMPARVEDALTVVTVPPAPPPPAPKTVPERTDSKKPKGAASPRNLRSKATPVVMPPPAVRFPLPPRVVAAPKPYAGIDPSTGASDRPGPGTGAGGQGTGTGSGGSGDGEGDGDYTPPRHIKGRIKDSDYPPGAAEAGVGGTVEVRYTVETNGRATHCIIVRSSGNAELDAATCRIIQDRFRYAPSRDEDGNPVRSGIIENHTWVARGDTSEESEARDN